MREWLIRIYASEWHANSTWRFSVTADSKAMAIAIAMWMFKASAEYVDDFHRVEADKI